MSICLIVAALNLNVSSYATSRKNCVAVMVKFQVEFKQYLETQGIILL